MNKRWEYLVAWDSRMDHGWGLCCRFPDGARNIASEPAVALNQLGQDGWELVSVVGRHDSESDTYYLKREIVQSESG